jgi:DNA invertase Pin-like site-specific DNA recombinase
MLVGYARVSSTDQRLDVQLAKLQAAQCEKVYQEKLSGRTRARPQLEACLDFVRDGDTLIVTKLDRLARSLMDLCAIMETLRRKQVAFQVLDQALDTSTSTGTLLFHVMGAIAEFENELRKERQMDGILLAKANGVRFGREKRLSPVEVVRLRQQRAEGRLIKELMAEYRLSKMSVYRYLAQGKDPSADLAAD